MTVPGGDSGEKAQGEADQPEQTSTQPGQHTPGESPYPPPSGFAEPSGPPAGYPPPAYPPPSEYPPPAYRPPSGYPPPGGYPPPEYQTAPGYGGSPYPPRPPEYGGPAGGYGRPPVGGYPIPDYPAGYGQQTRTNTLAVASLIASCLGLLCCGISSIVGVVLGAVALSQIRQTREEGYGLAVAGIVIGILIMLILLFAAILKLHTR